MKGPFRYHIKKSRGQFILLLGWPGDSLSGYTPTFRMYYAKLFPELAAPFATYGEAHAALKRLREYLNEKWAGESFPLHF